MVDFEHPTVGKIKIPGYPVHFSETSAKPTRAAPELGEHTEEVLTDLGKYSKREIAQLRKQGVI